MDSNIHLKIMSPISIVWESDVCVISAENNEGIFDILPDHARFMSLISTHPVQVELCDGSVQSFTFTGALLFFEDNRATIYVHELLEKINT